MRSAFLRLACAITGLLLIFLGIAPHVVDRLFNQLSPAPLLPISPQTRALMQRSLVVDLHGDSLMWRRDINRRIDHGTIDVPRLREGGIGLQVFSSVTKTPKGQNYESNGADSDNITPLVMAQLQPPRTWTSLLQRSLYHGEKLEHAAAQSAGTVRIIKSISDLDGLIAGRGKNRTIGTLLSVEGLQNLEGKLDNVDRLYDGGFRMLGLAHFFDNEVAGSVHGIKKHGLTPLGHAVITRMEKLGIMVDVAHASHQTMADVFQVARKPIVFSHGGVKGTCDTNRNLTDAEIHGIAKTDGIIGIGYWDTAICDASPKAIARAMTYVRDLVGARHVALGSDFDGSIAAPFDTRHVAQVAEALRLAGWTEADIEAAMGGNALRVFRATLPRR
jgi:microsomal dipeptidase-like Zn-dependent dipeptidase